MVFSRRTYRKTIFKMINLNPTCQGYQWRMVSVLHDRPLSSVARDESRMAGGEPRMAGDYCRPEESIHRCIRTHSRLYSYIYMAL